MDSIYLDNNASTRVDEEVIEAMLPYMQQYYANPAANLHASGWKAAAAVEGAREHIASLLDLSADSLIFTSGATESCQLAIKGVYEAGKTFARHILVAATEHKAILEAAFSLQPQGAEIELLPVDPEGRIQLSDLENRIRKDTLMVCVMSHNNETGVEQDIEAIGSICKDRKVLFFCDATQSIGKAAFYPEQIGIDLCSFSAHKFHGPKGIGALYIRRKQPRVQIQPLFHGGGQENGFRPGTLNVPGIIGMKTALAKQLSQSWDNNATLSKLRSRLEHPLLEIPGLRINGSTRHRNYHTSNIQFPGFKASDIIRQFPWMEVSSGSACSSGKPSHVLQAMGLLQEQISSSIRFSLSHYNTLEEINKVTEALLSLYS